ncbi:MAG: hypothetical protein FWD23_18015 [Oscillospiraceae bacterium]|nr:hypothetical protein [Oscillospiraceae bacterium]
MLNKNKPLSVQNIIDFIWSHEDISLESKAVHNLIFRLKRMFSAGDGDNHISFSTNGYMLNTEYFFIDIYMMEEWYNKSKACTSGEEKIFCLESAIDLYNGEYLFNLFDDIWRITAANRYSNMFINAVVLLSEQYLENEEYEKLFQVCDKALMLRPIEESVYICMLKGLMQTKQAVRAVSLCEKYFDTLYKEMGIVASEHMQALYAELKRNGGAAVYNSKILGEFKPEEISNNSYFCTYNAFNEIYKYELRQIERKSKNSSLLLLLSINTKKGAVPSANTLYEARRQLYESCLGMMRKGDAFASYSENQYIVLLTNTKYENYNIVIERLKNHFSENCKKKEITLNFKVKPLVNEWENILPDTNTDNYPGMGNF